MQKSHTSTGPQHSNSYTKQDLVQTEAWAHAYGVILDIDPRE